MANLDEDGTTFDTPYSARDDPATRERRTHTWVQRERMAWVSLASTIATIAGGFWLRMLEVITTGQWVLGLLLLFFIGGKSLVEAIVSIKGPKL